MIRTMAPGDLEPVLEIWRRGNLDAHPFVPADWWESNVPAVREQLPQAEVYVYESDGKILGFAGLQGEELAGLFVERSARSAGVGRALLDRVKALRPSFFLHVYRQNRRAAAFYLREGLLAAGEGTDADTGAAEYTMVWDRDGIRIVPLRERPELAGPAAAWFHRRWGVPLEAYRESIRRAVSGPDRVPPWYVALLGGVIVAGAGAIDNDFHDRPDLTPNLCALYVNEGCRNRGVARRMLEAVRRDLARMGVRRVYLVTDHIGFYEACGWRFLTMVRGEDGAPERMYQADTLPEA